MSHYNLVRRRPKLHSFFVQCRISHIW